MIEGKTKRIEVLDDPTLVRITTYSIRYCVM